MASSLVGCCVRGRQSSAMLRYLGTQRRTRANARDLEFSRWEAGWPLCFAQNPSGCGVYGGCGKELLLPFAVTHMSRMAQLVSSWGVVIKLRESSHYHRAAGVPAWTIRAVQAASLPFRLLTTPPLGTDIATLRSFFPFFFAYARTFFPFRYPFPNPSPPHSFF